MAPIENALPKPIERTLFRKDAFIQALFDRPDSLGELLPYESYVPQSGTFRMRDGSIGVVFEATLLEHEVMPADAILAAVDGLKTWLNLPTGYTLQIRYEQSYLSARDPIWHEVQNAYPHGHPVSKMLLDAKVARFREACGKALTTAPLQRKLYLSIRHYPKARPTGGLGQMLGRPEGTLFRETERFIREEREFLQVITSFEQSSPLKLKRLDGDSLLDVLRRFLNPKTYYERSFCRFNPNAPLSSQVIFHSPTLDYSGIEREGVRSRTFTLKTSPQYAYPGGMAYFTKLRFPFSLSLNISFPSRRKVKTYFDLKEFFLQNSPSARSRRQRQEVLEVQERLAHEDRCLQATINVIVEGETEEELDRRSRELVHVFQDCLECEILKEDKIGLGLCLNTLPLNYDPRTDLSAQRSIRVLRSDLTRLLPIFDSFRGTPNGMALYLSREGNLVRYSPNVHPISNHTVVLADTGSGKSALVNDIIVAHKRKSADPATEPMIFVIDKKTTSEMLSDVYGGELVKFDANEEAPFSPFRGIYDDAKLESLTRILIAGIKLTSPSFEIDSLHYTAIKRALKLAHQRRTEASLLNYSRDKGLQKTSDSTTKEVIITIEDVVAELASLPSEPEFEKSAALLDHLIQRLLPFQSEGPYGRYFRGPTKQRKRKAENPLFYIYDLDALDSDPIAQTLMTMAVIDEIRQIIHRPENRGRGGLLVVHELGMLGRDNPVIEQFLIDAAETFRKLELWLVLLTPRPQNFFELAAGRAAWSVATNFIFLQMSPDNVKYIAEHSTILNENDQKIVCSLRTIEGEHAEIFVTTKDRSLSGAFLYSQTPMERWLAPNNVQDNRAAKEALKKFGSETWQALEFLAREYPQGVARQKANANAERPIPA